MTRSTRITGALLAFFLLLAAGGLVLPATAGGTPTPDAPLDSDRYVVSGILVYDKETGVETVIRYGWFATQTPATVDSPTPSATATYTPAPPTSTPTLTPTSTATKTPTSQPSATPTASNTPAPTSLPTSTPAPTASPTVALTAIPTTAPTCYITIAGDVGSAPSNVRSGPSTGDTIIAKASPGTRWQIVEVRYVDVSDTRTDEWVRVTLASGNAGWIAVYHNNATLANYDTSDGCAALRWPGGVDPEPTSTPRPTDTPDATGAPTTPLPNVTPTPESGITPAPTAAPKACTVTLLENSMIRSGPGTSYAAVGSGYAGDPMDITQAAAGGDYVWGQHARGWTALYTRSTQTWRVGVWGSEGETCLDVPGWTAAGLGAPGFVNTAYGFTVVTGANRDELLDAGRILQAAGIQPVATVTCENDAARALYAAQWWVNYRPCWSTVGDLPVESLSPEDSARARVAQVLWEMGDTPATTVQITNEWQPASPQYANAWIVAAMDECVKRGVRCIPVVFAPGNPDIGWLEQMRPAMRAIRAGGGYLGYNSYPVINAKLSNLNAFTLWTTYRFRLWRNWLGEDMPQVFISEAAEYRGDSPPDVGDMASYGVNVQGEVAAVCVWYFGHPLAAWQNAVLNGMARHLAGLWVAALQ